MKSRHSEHIFFVALTTLQTVVIPNDRTLVGVMLDTVGITTVTATLLFELQRGTVNGLAAISPSNTVIASAALAGNPPAAAGTDAQNKSIFIPMAIDLKTNDTLSLIYTSTFDTVSAVYVILYFSVPD